MNLNFYCELNDEHFSQHIVLKHFIKSALKQKTARLGWALRVSANECVSCTTCRTSWLSGWISLKYKQLTLTYFFHFSERPTFKKHHCIQLGNHLL